MSPGVQMVSELMSQPVISVGPGASVEEVRTLAKSRGVHHVPIVQRGKVLGVVCTCDLNDASPDLRVLQLARRNLVTAEPNCSATDAAKLMKDNAVGSVLIANRDGLWGIVTRDDLSRADAQLARSLAELECAACHSKHHLRQSAGDTLLCVACAERASSAHWFDEGGGD
jgi:predicted transcriptional regulator